MEKLNTVGDIEGFKVNYVTPEEISFEDRRKDFCDLYDSLDLWLRY